MTLAAETEAQRHARLVALLAVPLWRRDRRWQRRRGSQGQRRRRR